MLRTLRAATADWRADRAARCFSGWALLGAAVITLVFAPLAVRAYMRNTADAAIFQAGYLSANLGINVTAKTLSDTTINCLCEAELPQQSVTLHER